MARRTWRRNPEGEIPYGEWVPAHAVMFQADGTVDVMTEPGKTLSNPDWSIPLTLTKHQMQDIPGVEYRGDFAWLPDGSQYLWDKRFDHWRAWKGPTQSDRPTGPQWARNGRRRRNASPEERRILQRDGWIEWSKAVDESGTGRPGMWSIGGWYWTPEDMALQIAEGRSHNRGWRRRNQYGDYEVDKREAMLRELAGNLADAVAAGEMTDQEANDWYNMKADQWAQGLS